MTDKEKIDYIKGAIETKFLLDRPTRSDKAEVEEMIDSLEKQVAQKASHDGCPNCSTYVYYDDSRKMNYCPECGQKLGWE